MTSPGGGFQHPRLADAAQWLRKLQQAASIVGSPDPVAALHYVDCSPDAIRAMADGVRNTVGTLEQAHSQFQAGRQAADQSWQGTSADAFNERAASTDTDYGAAEDATTGTADAGQRAAEGLDNLAVDAANQAVGIATSVDPACDDVINQQESLTAAAEVNLACSNIVTMVQQHVAEIPNATASLADFGYPRVGRQASGVHGGQSGEHG